MGLAGFEPATSHSEGGYPIHARLQTQKTERLCYFYG